MTTLPNPVEAKASSVLPRPLRRSAGLPARLALVGAGALCAAAPRPALAADGHPRLFGLGDKVADIQAAVANPGSHHAVVFAALEERVTENNLSTFDGKDDYARAIFAAEACFAYLLTNEQTYADAAHARILEIEQGSFDDKYGLHVAMVSRGASYAYDWCHAGWSESERSAVRTRLESTLSYWESFGHANVTASSHKGSNWVAVTRAAEGITLLALQEETNRSGRYDQVKSDLRKHLENGYGNLGYTQEGNGYLGYGGGFLGAGVLALAEAGETGLLDVFKSRNMHQQLMYLGSFTSDQTTVQYGVGAPGVDAEGLSNALLCTAPDSELPAYLHAYNGFRGLNNPAPASSKFGWRRTGSILSLLCYPTDVAPEDPVSSWPGAVADTERGMYLFRSAWRDASDVIVATFADAHHHNRGWDDTDAGTINVMAGGSLFIGGPQKTREASNFSQLLVDGKARADDTDTGAIGSFEARTRGGRAVIDGGQKFSKLGLSDYSRSVVVAFDSASSGIVSTLDQVQATGEHDYTYQLNLGPHDGSGGISGSQDEESGVPTFLLENGAGAFVKGWVLAPADATIESTSDPLKIGVTASSTDIWVVMRVGKGEVPTGTVTGSGLESELTVDDVTVSRVSGEVTTSVPDEPLPAGGTGAGAASSGGSSAGGASFGGASFGGAPSGGASSGGTSSGGATSPSSGGPGDGSGTGALGSGDPGSGDPGSGDPGSGAASGDGGGCRTSPGNVPRLPWLALLAGGCVGLWRRRRRDLPRTTTH